MSSPTLRPQDRSSTDEIEVRALYQQMMDAWNQGSGEAFAPFDDEGDFRRIRWDALQRPAARLLRPISHCSTGGQGDPACRSGHVCPVPES